MPAFDAAVISDAEMASDFDLLAKRAAVAGAPPVGGRTHPDTWSAEKVEQVLGRGLQVLRTPDRYGTACANCHSPDGIEMAFIGYTDADVLRRALQHVSPDEALDMVDYVHALRKKYGIEQPCSPAWRPFQPGGEPLPGETIQERELAFASELERRKVLLFAEPITSSDAALAAMQDLERLNLRELPVGVKFPRWSEDSFHGDEHKSFFDWMPGAGRVPRDPQAWYAKHDAYLADPTLEKLRSFDGRVAEDTDLGRTDSKGREFMPIAAAAYDAHGWVEEILLLKHRTVLLGAHFFRMALLGKPGWLEQPALPFTDLAEEYNPFFQLGMTNTESPCYNTPSCEAGVAAQYPEFLKEEVGPTDYPEVLSQRVLSDPWCYLGQSLDQALMHSENGSGPTQTAFYWNVFTFEHRLLQQPFFTAHRLATQAAYVTRYQNTDKLPSAIMGSVNLPTSGVHPFLHGEWNEAFGVETERVENDDARLGPSTFLRANVALMVAFIQRDLLLGGASVAARQKGLDNLAKLRIPADQMAELLEDETWAASNPRNRDNYEVLITRARELFDEVEALYRAAPEAP